MEQLRGISPSTVHPAVSSEEVTNVNTQIDTSDESSEERERIEREANFDDEVILKVGTRKICSTVYQDSMSDKYFSSLKNPVFCKKLSDLRTPEERVEYIGNYFIGVRIQPEIQKKYQKNLETSRQLRDHGNALFRSKSLQDALHYYNLALMFATTYTEAAGLAYANRSAILVELGHFQDALLDVDLALKNKCPEPGWKNLSKEKSGVGFQCKRNNMNI